MAVAAAAGGGGVWCGQSGWESGRQAGRWYRVCGIPLPKGIRVCGLGQPVARELARWLRSFIGW